MLYQCSLADFYVEQVALNRHVRRHFRLPCLCALRGKMSSESSGVGEPTHLAYLRQVFTSGNASTPRVPGRARYTPPPPLSRELKARVRKRLPPKSKLPRKKRGRQSLIMR